MNENEFIRVYWNRYLNIEESVLELERYIKFEEANFLAYSDEIQNNLMIVCSEIEAMYKLITNQDADVEVYIKAIINDSNYKQMISDKVILIKFGEFEIAPFCDAMTVKKCIWWDAYNELKHGRYEKDYNGKFNYTHANLQNLLNSLAALYLLEIYYYHLHFYNSNKGENNIPNTLSKLFVANDLKANFTNGRISNVCRCIKSNGTNRRVKLVYKYDEKRRN